MLGTLVSGSIRFMWILNIQQHSIYKITTVNIHKQTSFPHRDSNPDLRQSGMKVKYVTTRPPSPPPPQFELFDVSFPGKLLKIVATRGKIFSPNSPNTVWQLGSARTRWGS